MAISELGQRFGIPSIREGALRWFYGLFSVGTVYLTAANTISEVSRAKATDWLQVQSIATEQLVRGAGASLIIAYILADGGDMVISAILRERNRLKDLEAREKERERGLVRKAALKSRPFGKPGFNARKKRKVAANLSPSRPPIRTTGTAPPTEL